MKEKQQKKLKELEELQRKKMKEAEEKEKMETEIEDEIETLTGILNNTIQSGPEFLPKEMKDGIFNRKKLDEYKKRYQDSKEFQNNIETKINDLENLYNEKKEESETLQKSRVKALDEISKLPSLQDDNDVYNSFKKAITQATTIKSIDDIFNDALNLSTTLEQKKAERRKKLQQAAKKANNLSNAVKTFEDVLKDKSKDDQARLKELKKDTDSYIYKIIDNAERELASSNGDDFITFAEDTIKKLLLLKTFQESVKTKKNQNISKANH